MRVQWKVADPAAQMLLWDRIRVYRAAATAGPWTLLGAVDLQPTGYDYLFWDIAGLPSHWYQLRYYNSGTAMEGTPGAAFRGEVGGYCSIQDLRDEGYAATAYPDAVLARAIALATGMIERITRQWFEPRVRKLTIDARPGEDLHLDVPIILLTSFAVRSESYLLKDMLIYNRHLTQGLLSPDDRQNPRVSWTDDGVYPYSMETSRRRFMQGHRNVTLEGIFGYTELGAGDPVGETAPGSQVPLSYGRTPLLIRRACLLLAARYGELLASGAAEDAVLRGRLTGESTRDQSYSLAGPVGEDGAFGMTGINEVDAILMQFAAPLSMGIV